MTTAPKPSTVGILMAVHGEADPKHFAEAFASLKDQTHPSIRVFLHCDGPLPPAVESVIQDFVRPEDVVIRSRVQCGLATGLNRVIEESLRHPDIQFLARMDVDDLCVPTRIERQLQYLLENTSIDVVGAWCIEFAEAGAPLFYKKLPTTAEDAKRFMLLRSALAHPVVMFRRRVFLAGHRYDPRMLPVEDYALWSDLLHAGHQIANVPEYLLWHRVAGRFFSRRSGLQRATRELTLRLLYALRMKMLRPRHLPILAGLFLLRLAPQGLQRIAYRCLRT
jgi:GT2 family glycosyltransferase